MNVLRFIRPPLNGGLSFYGVADGGLQVTGPPSSGRWIVQPASASVPVVMRDPDGRFAGPLGTTVLVAMSTPMILLPIERMLEPAANRDSVADDRTVDETLGKAVAKTLSATARFGDAPLGIGQRLELRRRAEMAACLDEAREGERSLAGGEGRLSNLVRDNTA